MNSKLNEKSTGRIRGLFQIGRESPEIVSSPRLYLFVHPNLIAECGTRYEREEFASGQAKINNLLSNSTSPILIMEEESMIHDEIRKANERRDIRGSRYFLATEQLSPTPIEGWDNLSEIVRQFQPEEVIVGGVELGLKIDRSYGMCVGTTYNQLKGKIGSGVKLDFEMCHTRNEELKRIREHYRRRKNG